MNKISPNLTFNEKNTDKKKQVIYTVMSSSGKTEYSLSSDDSASFIFDPSLGIVTLTDNSNLKT